MATPSTPEKPAPVTMELATYRNTKNILQVLQPLASLAQVAQGSETEDGLVDMLLDTLRALLEGQEQLRQSLEALHARLNEPSLEQAVRAAAKA